MEEREDSGESAAEEEEKAAEEEEKAAAEEKEETRLSELDSGKVLRVVNHILSYHKDKNICYRIFLWFQLWTPPSEERVIHIPLPYDFHIHECEIYLYTKVEPDKSIDETKEFYREFLLQSGVTEKIEIIPVEDAAKSRTEEELKLLSRCNVFADEKIRPLLQRQCGESFCNQFVQFVDLESKNLAAKFNWRNQSTSLDICKKRSCSIFVAHTGMEPRHILDNVLAAAEVLAKELPMKWKDVRFLSLETLNVKAVPIYISSSDILKELDLPYEKIRSIRKNMRRKRKKWDNAACGNMQGAAESDKATVAPHKKPDNVETGFTHPIPMSSNAKRSKS